MFIYSIVPYEQMFPSGGAAQDALQPAAQDPQLSCRRVPGGLLEVSRSPQGEFVSRLISTDPRLYLNPAYLPGVRCPGMPGGAQNG
jgi:hypothetical protein